MTYHLKALLADEMVAARDEGRERIYRLTAPLHVRHVLTTFDPVPGELDDLSRLLEDILDAGRSRKRG